MVLVFLIFGLILAQDNLAKLQVTPGRELTVADSTIGRGSARFTLGDQQSLLSEPANDLITEHESKRDQFGTAFHKKLIVASGGYAILLPEFGLLSPHELDQKKRMAFLESYDLANQQLVNEIAQMRQDSLRQLYDILDDQQQEKLARKTGMSADAWCQAYDCRALKGFLPLLDCTMPLKLDAPKTDTDDFRRLTTVLLTWLHEIEMFAQDDSAPRDTRVQYSLHNWMSRWPKDNFIEKVYVLCVADFASGSEEGTDHAECLQLRQLAKRVEQRFRDFEVKLSAESEGPDNGRIAAIVRDENYGPFLKSLAALHNANAETDTSELYHQYLTTNGDCPFTLGEVSKFDDNPSPFVLDIYAKPSRISQQFQATKYDFPAVSGLENRLQNLARMRLYAITDSRRISERIDAQDAYLQKLRELLSPEQAVIFFNKLYASHGPIYYFSKPSVQEEFSITPEQIAAMRTRGKILANEIRETRNLALRNNLKRLIDALPEDIVQSICDKTQMTTTQLIQAMNNCPEEALDLKNLNSLTESARDSNQLGK